MGKPTGFKEYQRELPTTRPVDERVQDWQEIYEDFSEDKRRTQAARCMDCGIPFCNDGCPLGNLIPDWNDLVYRDHWKDALDALHKTNNFPEFTGRICPAPCEAACVLGINEKPVAIKLSEVGIIDRGFAEGWVVPEPPETRTGKTVAVIGSGPAGLAAAAQLNKAGHTVTVFERDERVGGLLTFGIPDFKLEKHVVERRVNIMAEEGVVFKTSVNVGKDITAEQLKGEYDAVVLAIGSTAPRNLEVEGRELDGVHFAMEFLSAQNEWVHNKGETTRRHISAKDKTVVILGGGDTGADCLGTSHRHGAKVVHQFELMPKPPDARGPNNPWPQWPMIMRTSSAHEEGGERDWSIMTKKLTGSNGKVEKLHAVKLDWVPDPNGGRPQMKEIEGSEFTIDVDLVLLAMGFLHPEHKGPIEQFGLEKDGRGNIKTQSDGYHSSVDGVFAAGDCRRGQSLVVWAISEGRKAAAACDEWLMGKTSLPK
jgi:glutamate synthase (NADPH/NADH) small chain